MTGFLRRFNSVVRNPLKILSEAIKYCYFFSDQTATKLRFFLILHRRLNLKSPKAFNEKIQWIKLNDKNPLYTQLADKYGVREYIKDAFGEQYLVNLYGVWEEFEDINFDELPDKFVLKCTHDCGSVIVCKDKSKFNIESTRKWFKKKLRKNFYWRHREWHYKNIKPRIIAEEYLEDASGSLTDYKIYCFNGQARLVSVSRGLTDRNSANRSFLTVNWEWSSVSSLKYKDFEQLPPRPAKLDEMLELSETISSTYSFLRVDLYVVGDRIILSELTLTPSGGMMVFAKKSEDELLGSWLKLP
ncbi:MAG: glycosyl transferase [Defluviitaleaceae bacterium]|nr:glycosyl transferase [Defluviitaleaceae bacterium]